MPILLKTQVDRTAKTPATARRARVGSLCGFQDTVERCTRRKPEDRTLRRRAGALRKWQTQKKNASGRISAEGEAASGEAGERPDAFLRLAVHFCPQCGQFRGIKWRFFAAVKSGMTLLLPKSRKTPVKSRTILTLFRFQEGLTMKTEERSRHTVWMEDTVWQRVQEHYKSDGCSTQNEFIAKAILFYCGYLQSEYAGDFLPKILGETLEAILSMFGDRIGKLLLKQAVEQNICNHILASDTDIDAATYQKMRGMSYQEVLRTNGQISFPEVLRQQKRL